LFSVTKLAEELFGFADRLCILGLAVKIAAGEQSICPSRKFIAAQSAKGVDDAGA
jgi:hypothetical protein